MSLDNNPLHCDDDYAKHEGLPSAFSAPGASLFTPCFSGILIAFAGLSCQFLKPSFEGGTLCSAVQAAELTSDEGKGKGVITMAISIHNQENKLVLTGQQRFTVKL